MNHMIRGALLASCAILPAAVMPVTSAYAQTASRNYSIAPQAMNDALRQYANQSGQDVVFDPALVAGLKSKGLQGSYDAETALKAVVRGTKLEVYKTSSGFALRGNGSVAITASDGDVAASSGEDATSIEQEGIAEILVVGSRSQNVDIRRTENDTQPYVVMDHGEIQRSGAQNLEELLRTRVLANTQSVSSAQAIGATTNLSGNISQVNLRGLNTAQTLILVDGRRAPRVLAGGFNFSQADIAGIPLTSIERVEILPSTAGGIYGGGAIGGVINIVRKRDYKGVNIKAGFDGTFRGGGEGYRLELTGGFALKSGSTQVSFGLAHSKSEPLDAKDNGLAVRGRQLFIENDPALFAGFGYTPNIAAQRVLVPTGPGPTNFPGCASLPGGSSVNCFTLPNLVLDGGALLGSPFTFVPIDYSGIASDSGALLIGNAGRLTPELSDDANGRFYSLLTGTQINSANINIRQEITDRISLFADLSAISNDSKSYTLAGNLISFTAANPGNPFQQAISVYLPYPGLPKRPARNEADSLGVTGGVIAKLWKGWSGAAEYSWSRSRTKYSSTLNQLSPQFYADVRSGVINIFRDINKYPIDYGPYILEGPDSIGGPFETTQRLASLRLSGSLVRLPGGNIQLSTLLEHRKDNAAANKDVSPFSTRYQTGRSQKVSSIYGEVLIPIFSELNYASLFRQLELTLALRQDWYKTRGAPVISVSPGGQPPQSFTISTNEVDEASITVSGKYAPLTGVTFRGSYATGFLPPDIFQLSPSVQHWTIPAGPIDPLRGEIVGTSAPFDWVQQGNPDLEPEHSKSFSVGIILQPSFLPGARVSLDYTQIKKKGEITSLPAQTIMNDENEFPGRVVRGPSVGGVPGPVVYLDSSFLNVFKSMIKAFDFKADYSVSGGFGSITSFVDVTYQPHRQRQVALGQPFVELAGYSQLLKWRSSAGIDWTKGPVGVGWNVQFYDKYDFRSASNVDPASPSLKRQGELAIPSQIYNDLVVRYKFDSSSAPILRATEIVGTIRNVFDKKPPVVGATVVGYSPYGDPRLRRFSISLLKSF